MQEFNGLTRREFLKLISLIPPGIYSRPVTKMASAMNIAAPNIIIIVFDAWSQHNVSLYGYPRHTMPNLEKFAENATVYHRHYSTGTFTVPSVSSILTGLHPWSHRALQLGAGISSLHIPHTVFSALASTHSTLGFTQNRLADQILYQLEANLDQHVNAYRYYVQDASLYDRPIFKKDPRMAFASLEDNIVQQGEGFDSSLFLGPLYRLHIIRDRERAKEKYHGQFPLGVPES